MPILPKLQSSMNLNSFFFGCKTQSDFPVYMEIQRAWNNQKLCKRKRKFGGFNAWFQNLYYNQGSVASA